MNSTTSSHDVVDFAAFTILSPHISTSFSVFLNPSRRYFKCGHTFINYPFVSLHDWFHDFFLSKFVVKMGKRKGEMLPEEVSSFLQLARSPMLMHHGSGLEFSCKIRLDRRSDVEICS